MKQPFRKVPSATIDLPAEDATRIAATLLEVAASVELHERKMKECLQKAAKDGNLPLVRELMDLWLDQKEPDSRG